MKNQMNANYAFVFYDVNEKRVTKVFKICKKYLNHYQKSTFRGGITPSNLLKMEKEIRNIINEGEDLVTIIKMLNEYSFDEIEIGYRNNSDLLFL
ncbi:CRISPR-associated endonuclease Cas2 (plasmid) [Bacillus cereus]|uniref:CRISPR-associated endonuclease Cas2 n=1 Tax=Bacillus cereus group TaxID=86661 RepID=UPI000B44C567|nr:MULTISPECIES: CRISPR-associated endonuclease Cas2 [Bacillus cereus group]OTW84704.1 CRISPR-associated endonuclease Cas2 [Bacillus thuringiensis serovar jinghongiensis]OTX25278.1 CRISPR-associated endonuclease Cas2 [Bacillus thuringiensis serovar japonensis]PFN49335.1 CRISPR-associated endonuclease Cas2 [Bacillus cereus]PGQ95563.1 CRISPR-associated endonuclease Cas2 [Bacillus cereus]WBO70376.1 CRISPR-associated endonuclease Cas2 [Bacillus cereus]